MDVDAYVAAHSGEWARLEQLLAAHRNLDGPEIDELVALYGRTATHLSVIRSSAPDPALVSRLSTLVARARGAVTGAPTSPWREAGSFLTSRFPAALYRTASWWVPTALAFLAVSFALGWWVATHPEVQASVASPEQIRQLVEKDFENYYSESPAASFAAKVWTNNAWVAALSLASGILVLPVFWGLWQNAVNVAVAGGLMAAGGKLDIVFGLITPLGLLERTAVFVAAGAGLRLGWCWISPGRRTRSDALAEEGRVAAGLAVGLVLVLFVSGVIEAFVTPSPLPTWARVGIGVVVEILFLLYVFVLGRRAALGGETGDVGSATATDLAPTAA